MIEALIAYQAKKIRPKSDNENLTKILANRTTQGKEDFVIIDCSMAFNKGFRQTIKERKPIATGLLNLFEWCIYYKPL